MIYTKTEAGQQALKDRSQLTPRLRSAFILFDGKRSLQQVLEATAGLGVSLSDLEQLVEKGLLEQDMQALVQEQAAAAAHHAAEVAEAADHDAATERYQRAYPLAAQLTAGLGLRGFRLNLAVEGAADFNDLLTLLPKIKEAAGPEKCRLLERALKG